VHSLSPAVGETRQHALTRSHSVGEAPADRSALAYRAPPPRWPCKRPHADPTSVVAFSMPFAQTAMAARMKHLRVLEGTDINNDG
jgi:hypothetical protein